MRRGTKGAKLPGSRRSSSEIECGTNLESIFHCCCDTECILERVARLHSQTPSHMQTLARATSNEAFRSHHHTDHFFRSPGRDNHVVRRIAPSTQSVLPFYSPHLLSLDIAQAVSRRVTPFVVVFLSFFSEFACSALRNAVPYALSIGPCSQGADTTAQSEFIVRPSIFINTDVLLHWGLPLLSRRLGILTLVSGCRSRR